MAALRYMSGKQLAAQRSERPEKLAWIERQVAAGELVIRQATRAERARYGITSARPAPAKRSAGRRAAHALAARP
jgi:hypothetical protein